MEEENDDNFGPIELCTHNGPYKYIHAKFIVPMHMAGTGDSVMRNMKEIGFEKAKIVHPIHF